MWIEIFRFIDTSAIIIVTPRAGVWIEICFVLLQVNYVTPRAGVWIEIVVSCHSIYCIFRHSPCGSVD